MPRPVSPAVAATGETRVRKQFLVKWKGLPYAECTWEWEVSGHWRTGMHVWGQWRQRQCHHHHHHHRHHYLLVAVVACRMAWHRIAWLQDTISDDKKIALYERFNTPPADMESALVK